MNTLVHSQLSVHNFGGEVKDYFEIHKFIDSSKLFFFNIKHRSILHHTFGVHLCTTIFGDTLKNSEGDLVLVRDVAIEHIKEDLNGRIPILKEWFEDNPKLYDPIKEIESIKDEELKNFILSPYLNSGIKSSFVLTYSDFGVSLVDKVLGINKALILRSYLNEKHSIKSILKNFKFSSRWQYTPDVGKVALVKNNH